MQKATIIKTNTKINLRYCLMQRFHLHYVCKRFANEDLPLYESVINHCRWLASGIIRVINMHCIKSRNNLKINKQN
jgi:hypothetical protein